MFYISVGQGNGMYTLREEYVVKTNYGLDVKHHYIRNLSRDWNKAIAKAKEIVGDNDLFVGDESHLNEWGDADKYYFEPYTISKEESERREIIAKQKAKAKAERIEELRLEQEAYDKAKPIPVTDNRIKFTGIIEKTYSKTTEWGIQFKMFFVDDRGFKLNGSMGKAFEEKYDFDEDGDYRTRLLQEGTRVSFMASVKPSADPKFGFFKRPTKVELLKEIT
jgi:hypothetical protein